MKNIPLPSCREDLASHVKLAEVTSEDNGKRAWTVLGLWWRSDEQRPFVAVVEGRVHGESEMLNRFRATAHGTLLAALESFDQSQLRDELVAKIPTDVAEHYPEADVIRQREAAKRRAERSYKGDDTLKGALNWLYGPGFTNNALGAMVEEDFGVKARTVRHALDNETTPGGWAAAFVRVLRHFDRQAWDRQRSGLEKGA